MEEYHPALSLRKRHPKLHVVQYISACKRSWKAVCLIMYSLVSFSVSLTMHALQFPVRPILHKCSAYTMPLLKDGNYVNILHIKFSNIGERFDMCVVSYFHGWIPISKTAKFHDHENFHIIYHGLTCMISVITYLIW